MTPEDLNDAVDAIVSATTVEPVLVVLDGVERPLARVEARTDGRLVLHAAEDEGATYLVTREMLAQLLDEYPLARRAVRSILGRAQ